MTIRRQFRTQCYRYGIMIGIWISSLACQDLTGSQTLENANWVPPGTIQTAEGAYRLAANAQSKWQQAFATYIVVSGVMTDELQSSDRGSFNSVLDASAINLLDARVLAREVAVAGLEGENAYTLLHQARGTVRQAIGALTKYAGDSSRARRAVLYTYIGYSEIMLADLFCSGIPLSTWDFEKDYTYRPGSTTAEVYNHAVSMFDTALALSGNSLPVLQLAQVGKGRALLALGQFAEAAQAVETVPMTFEFVEHVHTCGTPNAPNCSGPLYAAKFDLRYVTVSDMEGGNSKITWTNPRTRADLLGTSTYGFPVYLPQRYAVTGTSVLPVASGIEAALIRAEAAFHADDIPGGLGILNALRTSSPATDTMATITDPGPATRADTLFAERAQWLFLTGHRQGDLRRWLRQDPAKVQQAIYPTGAYPGGIRSYGGDVTMPIPESERANPLFRGCFDRTP